MGDGDPVRTRAAGHHPNSSVNWGLGRAPAARALLFAAQDEDLLRSLAAVSCLPSPFLV